MDAQNPPPWISAMIRSLRNKKEFEMKGYEDLDTELQSIVEESVHTTVPTFQIQEKVTPFLGPNITRQRGVKQTKLALMALPR